MVPTPALVATAFSFGLLLIRASTLLMVAPVTSARGVPARARLGLAVAVGFAAFSGAGAPALTPPTELSALVGMVVREAAVGLAAGLGARMVFEAAHAAGQLAGASMGFGFAALVDPASGVEANPIGQAATLLALGMAVALGLHREVLAALALSARALPPGTELPASALLEQLIHHGLWAVALSVRLAFPILTVVLVSQFALALVGRAAPQLNLQSVGFAATILVGALGFYLAAPGIAELATRASATALQGG